MTQFRKPPKVRSPFAAKPVRGRCGGCGRELTTAACRYCDSHLRAWRPEPRWPTDRGPAYACKACGAESYYRRCLACFPRGTAEADVDRSTMVRIRAAAVPAPTSGPGVPHAPPPPDDPQWIRVAELMAIVTAAPARPRPAGLRRRRRGLVHCPYCGQKTVADPRGSAHARTCVWCGASEITPDEVLEPTASEAAIGWYGPPRPEPTPRETALEDEEAQAPDAQSRDDARPGGAHLAHAL